MPITAGTRLGRYEVRSQIGAGGMGEVYLAFDTELDRTIALKILPVQLAGDPQRMRRFVQEAKAASSLNHQNIITIYEIGDTDSTRYIATEFVDGLTLRQRIKQSPLSVGEVFEISIQIASALVAAHEAGIIHRDIKPENIMLRSRDGFVKVLDFGLVKLTEPTTGLADTEAPTRALVNTDAGTVMGTVSYMSPEQARGKAVDARTDIWSLGAILYEMLTGQTPFSGETSADVIASIMKSEPPPIARYTSEVPDKLVDLVSKALEKDRDERYQTIKDLLVDLRRLKKRFDFENEMERSVSPDTGGPTASRSGAITLTQTGSKTLSLDGGRPTSSAEYIVSEIKRHKTGAVLISVVVLLLLVGAGAYFWPRREVKLKGPSLSAMKITRLTSGGSVGSASIDGSTSISPDGKYVVFTLAEGGMISLWVRQISTSSDVQIVPPAEGSSIGSTISPDGEFVYHVWRDAQNPNGVLYQVPILGGTRRSLLQNVGTPISISPDGQRFTFIRFVTEQGAASLMIANIDGSGERLLATRKGNDWFSESGPSWSPDGKLIACGAGTDTGGTYMTILGVPVDGGTPKPLTSHKWFGQVYRVAWLSDGSGLVALASSDLQEGVGSQLWFISQPEGAVRRVTNDLNGYGRVSLGIAADNKTIVTAMSDTSAQIWVTGVGEPSAKAKRITNGKTDGLAGLSWLSDGRLIYTTQIGDNSEFWTIKADGSDSKQLFADNNPKGRPVLTPDGKYIFFDYTRNNKTHVWRLNSDGSGLKQITDGDYATSHPSCSTDGKWILFLSWRDGNHHLWKVSVEGGEAVKISDKLSMPGSYSPDGKTIAYGYFEPGGAEPWRLALQSSEGGTVLKTFEPQPSLGYGKVAWTADGRSLIYEGRIARVDNLFTQPIDEGKPRQLTDFPADNNYYFALSSDGKQLAISRGKATLDVVVIKDFR